FTSHLSHSTLFPYTTLFRSHCAHRISRSHWFYAINLFNDFPLTYGGGFLYGYKIKSNTHPLSTRLLLPGVLVPTYSSVDTDWYRSEEHTSELQSRFDLVCRL